MFALDLTNYSRWLPVHIRDLLILNEKHPSVFAEFVRGKFVVQKSQHFFSLIALDHNHEQENEIIKGDGRAVGLTKNPIALKRWMVAGPEIARVVKEFDSNLEVTKPCDKGHHEQTPSVQKAFFKDVQALISVLEDMGSPFKAGFHMIADRRSQKVLRSSTIIWKHTSAIVCDRLRSSAIVCDRLRSCDHMETKVLRSAIETYPIIFLILTHDSTLLSRKALI